MEVSAKARGKTILSGEHIAVYGYPALLLPLNVFVKCTISEVERKIFNNGVRIEALGEQVDYSWEEINHYCSSRNNEQPETKFGLVLTSLKSALEFFKIEKRLSFKLIVESSIPVGGFGSSTAVSAAIVKCIAKLVKRTISCGELWKLLIKIETSNGAAVSGADQCVVSYESPIKFQKYAPVEKIQLNSKILKKFLIIQDGTPTCTTRECIDFVARERKSHPRKINMIFRHLAREGEKMLDYLNEDNVKGFFTTVKKSGELLISLGIVSADSVSLISKIEDLGGYLKLTGAGTVESGGSGGILCFSHNYPRIESFLLKNNVKYLAMSI